MRDREKTPYEDSRSRSLLSLARLLIIIIVAPGRPNRFLNTLSVMTRYIERHTVQQRA